MEQVQTSPSVPQDFSSSSNKNLSDAIDAWGLARSKAFSWIVLGVTLALVLMEVQYNFDLLSTISDPSASKAVVGGLSQRGKFLAAFGITWAVARTLLIVVRPFLLGVVIFISLAFCTYHGLDYIYTTVIANLKPEIKVKGFGLFSYRRDLLTENLVDEDIPLPKRDPILGKIFMGAFPIVLLDDRFMLPVQDTIEVKASHKGKEVLIKADNEWPRYEANMRDFRNAHEKFVADSKKAVDTSNLEVEWRKYDAKMQELRAGYNRFIEGSHKALRYGNRGIQQFRSQAGGLSPNTNLSLHQFPSLLRSSSLPQGEQLRQDGKRELGQRANGKRVYVSEMPYFMGRAEFMRWVTTLANESFMARGFTPDPKITRDGFVNMLRNSTTKEGERIRNTDAQVLGKRLDGTPVLMRELPYFLDHDAYLRWFSSQADEAKNSVLPTVNNVEKFSDIQDVNSAVFLPPMAIISSLISAVTNGLTFVIVLLGMTLSILPGAGQIGRMVVKLSAPIMLSLFITLLFLMPSHVFTLGTPIYELETQLHEHVGFFGHIWSRLSNFEKFILKSSS